MLPVMDQTLDNFRLFLISDEIMRPPWLRSQKLVLGISLPEFNPTRFLFCSQIVSWKA
jgi:hypothetical protein